MKHAHRTVSLSVIATIGVLLMMAAMIYLPFQVGEATSARGVAAGAAAKDGRGGQPLEKMLNPDGSLNFAAGFSGSLDAHGYRMEYASNGAPRFVPLPTSDDDNWDAQFNSPGTGGGVNAIAVLGGDLYVGGSFTTAGGVIANHIAKWNGSNWSSLSGGVNGTVYTLEPIGSDLYVGGGFTTAGGANATYIAKWNGTAWSSLGSGVDSTVFALKAIGSDLYVGGAFLAAGGMSANYIAKWNASGWSTLGSGISGVLFNTYVYAFAVIGNDLYVGGQFTTAGGVSASSIAKWDGSSWSALGDNIFRVAALAVIGSNLYVAGRFRDGGITVNGIISWNGSAWAAPILSFGGSPEVSTLTVNGSDLYAGGIFTTAGGASVSNIAKWNGSSWSALGSEGNGTNGPVSALKFIGGNLYVGGSFATAGEVIASNIAKWSGSSWSPLGSGNGLSPIARAVTINGNDVYVGGNFTTAGGVIANNIAKWNGTSWVALGGGVNGPVFALEFIGANLYASGNFTTAGGTSANFVAKWNGSSWSALGGGVNGPVFALESIGSDLYAGGNFTTAGGTSTNFVAKWNGSSWSALGSGVNNIVYAIKATGGNLYVGGFLTMAGGGNARAIAKWNGSAWSALGSGFGAGYNESYVYAIADSGSDLFVGGTVYTQFVGSRGYIAKWDGSDWSSLGLDSSVSEGKVAALAVKDSDLYVGGYFNTAGGVSASSIAKWNGGAWSPLGSGVGGSGASDGYLPATVYALAASESSLNVGGNFTVGGGKPSSYFGRYSICTAPSITTQPISQNVTTGSSVTFSVTATGTAPLSYQWRKDGSNINGATGSSYTIASAALANAGSYDVIVTNGCGTITSSVATLMVSAAPAITEPIDGSLIAGLVTIRATGGTGNLTLEVHGTMPVTQTLTPPSGSMTNGTTTWNVSSINEGDKFAITVKDTNNVSSATVNVTVKPLIEVKLRIVDSCNTNNAWNIDKVPTTPPPDGSLSFVTLSNSGMSYVLPVDSQGRFTSKNMLNCTNPSNCQPVLESSFTGPISLNSSADLHYNDHITANSGGILGCDAPATGVVPRTAKAGGQSVTPTQGSPTVSNVDFPLPIFMIHGVDSCYSEAWGDWVPYLNNKGYITFTPNHGFADGTQRAYALETISQMYADLGDLLSPSMVNAPDYYIIAHSQGGVVSRVATQIDSRVSKQLKRIYTLGTPHSGTLFPFSPIYSLDSFFMQAFFNSTYPGFKYRTGSTNIPSDFVFAIGGTAGLGNDGIVYPQSSAFGIYGLIGTYQSFSEHQSDREFPFNHSGLHGTEAICSILERTIIADMRCQSPATCPSAMSAGIASPDQPIVDSQNGLLSVQSSTQTTTVVPVGYQTLTLSAGQAQTVSFQISSATAAMFSCSPFGITTTTSITTPSGIVITASNVSSYPSITYENDGFGQRYTVASPQAGNWTMSVTAGSQSGIAYLSAVEQATWQLEGAPDRVGYAAAAPVILRGRLTGDFNSVSSVSSVTATVKNSSGATIATSTLFDDGLHNDATAGDKVYGNSINAPSTAGSYQVAIQADGAAQGNPFRRQVLSRFDVTPPTHLFTGTFSASALDTNGDTKFDTLDETIGLNVPAAGQYTVAADLFDGNGNLIDHAVQTISPATAGAQQAILRFGLFSPSCSSFTSGLKVKNLTIADAVNSLLTLDLWTPDINVTGFTGAQFGCTGTIDANLAVSSNASPNPVSAGNVVTYTVTVSNAGPNAASSVNVANNLPAMTTLVSCAATNGGVCGGAGYSSAAVTFPTLASGASATITLLASLNAATPNGATLTMVTTVNAATTDTNANNNTATATTQVSNPTLPTIAEFSPASSSPGATVAISGTLFTGATFVKFNGTNAAFNVVNTNLILATVPAGATTGLLTVTTPNGTATSASNFSICTATINPTAQNFAIGGGIGNVSVTAATGCAWAAISNANWIALVNSGGTGSNSVSYVVAPNDGAARTGTISVAGQTFTVSQGGDCSFTINPISQNFAAAGGSNSVSVTTGTGCAWTATSNAAWITITGGSSGSGNGSVNYSVTANSGPQRMGTMTIAGQTFTVMQDNGCSFLLTPSSQNFAAVGGSNSVSVTAGAGCNWMAASNAAWITVTSGPSGNGNGSVSYSVAANTGAIRMGTMTIAGQTFTVNQSSGCTFTINPTNQNFAATGGNGNVAVNASDATCTWAASSNVAWIMITGGASGNGNGTVSYAVATNSGPQRSGTMTIAGQTFTVNQNSGCAFTINPTNQNFVANGGGGIITVTATDAACSWTAMSNAAWVTINSGASGSGNGTVNFTVAANSGPQRTGTMTIAGQTFTVTQDGGCTFTINSTSQNFAAGGGSNSVGVATVAGCAWMATSNAVWITITSGSSGSGSGTVNYNVAANTGGTRTGTMTIADQTFTVNQDCPGFSISNHPSNQTVCAGAPASFSVMASGTGPFTYQWRKNAVNIPGATGSSYSIASAATGDAGIYDVVITGACGATTSNTATLTVNAATGVALQPISQTVCAGAPASFSVTPSGTGPFTYQWRKNGSTITGATGNPFNIGSTTADDAGSYDVIVTGACGSATSDMVTLTVNATTAITTHPVSQTKIASQSVTFSVTATGTNLTYQWRKNSVNIGGATASSYTIAAVAPGDAGSYDVVVSGACGNPTSNAVTLTVNCQTITVSPPVLGSATTGVPFNQTFTQTGGNGQITWTLIGATPPGLSFNAAAATLSGAPTASGSFPFSIRATDINDCFGETPYTLGVGCASVIVNPDNETLPYGTAGMPYSQSFTASGGTPPYSFTTSAGTPPPGLNLNPNGTLSGTPTVFGLFNFTIKATDAKGCFGERPYNLRICGIISLTTSLPAGTTGVAYNQTITASGGASPYTFAVTGGNLPPGLSLSGGGTLAGTPTQSDSFNFTVTATDDFGCTGAQSYTVEINCQTVTITQTSLPNGFVGTNYNQTLTASGGTAPYSFTISAGTQPGGLNLSSGNVLSGTPAAVGTFNFTVKATDANGCMGTRPYTVIISGSGLQFYPLPSPVRLLETRAGFSGCANPGNPINANDTFMLPARTPCAGIPANAAAITGNITVVPSGGGYLTLFPSTAAQPQVANSNFAAGEITNNVFTVALGAGDGAFKIFTSATTHIIADVTGYYAPPATGGLYFHPLSTPVRLLETRAGFTGCFAPGTPLTGTGDPNADPNLDLPLQGRSPIPSPCNSIPATAQVLVGNATSVLPSGGGYLTIYPSGGTRPTVASSNYAGSDVINGPFAVKLGADGKFKVYTFATTHLVVDILGYYSEEAMDANGPGLLFNPLPAPVRLLETRPDFPGFPLTGCTRTNAKIPGNPAAATYTQSAAGFCGLPATAQAVVGNVSVVNSEAPGYLTLFPGNLTTAPLVATSNYPAPATFGYNRHYFVGLSPVDGKFKVLTQFTTDLILDASGYFAP